MKHLFRLPVALSLSFFTLCLPVYAALTQGSEMPSQACTPAVNAYLGDLPNTRTELVAVSDIMKVRTSTVTDKRGVTLAQSIHILIVYVNGEASTFTENFGIEGSGTEVVDAAIYLASLTAFVESRAPDAPIVHARRREVSGFERNRIFSVNRYGQCISARLFDLPYDVYAYPARIKR